MKCNDINNYLSDYLEQNLDHALSKRIADHLRNCESCGRLKERMEQLLTDCTSLNEDIPFFLRNRLYYIPESKTRETKQKHFYVKWAVAMVGTFLLFLNLFYFTNISPAINRHLHSIVSEIGIIAVQAESIFQKVKVSRNLLLFLSFKKESSQLENKGERVNRPVDRKGGKNG